MEWQCCSYFVEPRVTFEHEATEVEMTLGTSKNETKKDTKLPVQSLRFANPKSDKEVNEMRATAIPKKTKEDTEYCMRIWNAWWKERITET